MSTSDPVAHANSLFEKERFDEALQFSTNVSAQLQEMLRQLEKVQARTYSRKFEYLAAAGDFAGAEAAYDALHQLRHYPPLEEASVERRYLQAMFATRTSVLPLQRKARHLVLARQLRRVFHLVGDIAECGCFRGLSAWMISATLSEENGGFDGSGFHVFDSFAGLSEPSAEDLALPDSPRSIDLTRMMVQGGFAYPEEKVRRNLQAFPGISYYAGWLPQSLESVPERRYRFVHVDVDLYEPSVGILEYFYPRLVPGGLILTDDYGWPGTRLAFDQFCEKYGIAIEVMDDHQAVLQKS